MAFDHPIIPKSARQPILSADWNTGFAEVVRLDRDKLNNRGPAAITGQLAVDDLVVRHGATLPDGSATLAMLGLVPTVVDFQMPHRGNGRLVLEQYAAGAAPTRIPAFARIVSANGPIRITGEQVQAVSGSGMLLERSISLTQNSGDFVTARAVVFSPPPPAASPPGPLFRPTFRLDFPPFLGTGTYVIVCQDSDLRQPRLVGPGMTGLLRGVPLSARSSASIATMSYGGYVVAINDMENQLRIGDPVDGALPALGLVLLPGTSPSVVGLGGADYQAAYQSKNMVLGLSGSQRKQEGNLGIAPTSSPSIAALADGNFVVAYVNDSNLLAVYESAINTGKPLGGQRVATGTNPSACALPTGGFTVAYHEATSDQAVLASSDGSVVGVGLRMTTGTSPSIAALPGGAWMGALHADDNTLWTFSAAGHRATGQGMAFGASPSVAALPGGSFEIAYQADNGNLWVFGAAGRGDTGLVMRPPDLVSGAWTTPSIAGGG